MKKTYPKIVFFGSGPVAAKSLQLLLNNFEIEAVVTKPKPDHHRGVAVVPDLADKLGLSVYTVKNKTELSKLMSSAPFSSSLGILIDFGIIVDQDVIDYFPLGIINSHFSLLPELRGADPISFAILNGLKTTGVSLMLLVKAMDEGPILANSPFEMPADVTTPELTEALIDVSYQSLSAIVPLYKNGTIVPVPQESSIKPTYSRKLDKSDGVVDWNKSATQIEREVRAFIDWPKTSTMIGSKEVILTKVKVMSAKGTPGSVIEKKTRLIIACGQDALEIIKLKPAGKREMSASEFLAGYSQQI